MTTTVWRNDFAATVLSSTSSDSGSCLSTRICVHGSCIYYTAFIMAITSILISNLLPSFFRVDVLFTASWKFTTTFCSLHPIFSFSFTCSSPPIPRIVCWLSSNILLPGRDLSFSRLLAHFWREKWNEVSNSLPSPLPSWSMMKDFPIAPNTCLQTVSLFCWPSLSSTVKGAVSSFQVLDEYSILSFPSWWMIVAACY